MWGYLLALVGILIVSYVPRVLLVGGEWWLWGGLVSFVGLLSFWGRVSMRWRLLLLAVMIAGVLGWRTTEYLQRTQTKVLWSDSIVEISGVVSDTPRLTGRSVQAVVDARVPGVGSAVRLAAVLPYHTSVEYGREVVLKGKIQSLENTDDGYRNWLISQGIKGQMMWPEWQEGELRPPSWLIYWGWRVQQSLCAQVQRLLPSDESAFLLGVVLGADLPLSGEFDEALRRTGTSHLIVASGYNISVLIVLVMTLASRLPRAPRHGLTMIVLGMYVFISGADPSIIRAAIMGLLVITSISLGRQRVAQWFLLVTAVLMLLIYPGWMDQLGFQLSFAATLGLLLFQEPISRLLPASLPGVLAESISSTSAAQLLVLPLLMQSFGQVSSISLIANVLILWLTPWVMLVGMMVVGGAMLLEPLAQWLAWGIYPWLWYIKQVIMQLSRLPWSSVDVSGWSWLTVLYCMSMLVGAVAWRLMRWKVRVGYK